MLRNSFKYVNYSDLKKFSSDFKAVYNAPNETAAWFELETVREKWGKKYPCAISNWENNWEDVSSFFQFSDNIRRIMYTTNIIEALNRQYRKVTKTKSVFPSDQSLEKMLYLASENIIKKWTQRYRGWDQVLVFPVTAHDTVHDAVHADIHQLVQCRILFQSNPSFRGVVAYLCFGWIASGKRKKPETACSVRHFLIKYPYGVLP